LRLGMPRPPQTLGEATLSQATKQWPPWISSLPFHKKARQILRSASKTYFVYLRAIASFFIKKILRSRMCCYKILRDEP
jgi:hypothetical protein